MGDAIGVPIYYLGSYRFSCVYLSGTGHGLFFKYLIILFRGAAPRRVRHFVAPLDVVGLATVNILPLAAAGGCDIMSH